MDSNREERRLQRQRGAQRHQVQDVDFGSPFPTAAVAQRITRSGATIPTEIPPQSSRKRTPASRGRGSTSKSKSAQSRATPTPTAVVSDANISANTSVKRRKLNTPPEAQPSPPTSSSRPRASAEGDVIDEAQEDTNVGSSTTQIMGKAMLDNADSGDELDDVQPVAQTPKFRRVKNISDRGTDEVAESPRHAPGSGQRQQVTFQEPQLPVITLFENVGQQAPAAQLTNQSAGTLTKLSPHRSPRNPHASSPADTADVIDELSPDGTGQSHRGLQQEQFSDEETREEGEAEAINDTEVDQGLQKKRKQKSRNEDLAFQKAVEEGPDRDDEEQEEAEPSPESHSRPPKAGKQKHSKVKASPAAQRQPKQKSKPKSKSMTRKSNETIPVIVHRLTKPIPYGEDDTDADILNEDIPFAKRGVVNAVDVFSQFCEEVVESGLAALEEGGSNAEDAATRKEYRTKLRAIEAFQEELRTRLLELTITLDTNYLLNKRVKAAQRQKIDLRENLLRVRAEREKLALRMDKVRIKHENSSKEAQEQAALSTALHDIELAVSRGIERTSAGGTVAEPAPLDLPILLKTIAGTVSSNSAEGGILKQVKDFNAFLESAALALESRS